MNRLLIIIFFQSWILLTLSCSKKGSENPDSPVTNDFVELRVLEDKTDSPIADAEVRLEKCSNYDPVFGCVGYSLIKSLVTNSEGKYKFLKSLPVERISVKHPRYWQSGSTFLADIKLIPEAFSEVHLKKVNSYSSDYTMSIYVSRSDVFTMYPQETRFAIPADTTIYLRSYGNYENVVWWAIGNFVPIIQISKEGQSVPYFINAFDTTRVEIDF